MSMDTQAFFGAVMKAIACTPNQNFDDESYRRGVVEPTREIRRLAEELGGETPGDEDVRRALSLLAGVLEVKAVEAEERRERLEEVFTRSGLSARRAELWPGAV